MEAKTKFGTLALLAIFAFGCILMSGLVGNFYCKAQGTQCTNANQSGWNVASVAIIFVMVSFGVLLIVAPDVILSCAGVVARRTAVV